jgi:hypothetical protein
MGWEKPKQNSHRRNKPVLLVRVFAAAPEPGKFIGMEKTNNPNSI